MARVVYGNLEPTAELLAAFQSRDVQITTATAERFTVTLNGGNIVINYTGQFQTAFGTILGGTFTSVEIIYKGQMFIQLLELNEPFASQSGTDFSQYLNGNDVLAGSILADDILGYGGADSLSGGDGADSLRGGDGADTVSGGAGNDVHVNGNAGADIVSGGAGNDTVYGGKDNDTVSGDEGDDRLSGDLGNDVLTGGAGADRFVLRAGAGADTVTDFNMAQGDRILLATGTAYTNAVVGGNVVVTVGDANITLTGVGAFSADMVAFA